MKVEVKLPQLTWRADCCAKIQALKLNKIAFLNIICININ